jgi:hypothetical protein
LEATAEMSKTSGPYNEIDDYIAAFSDEEHQEYAAAETALDLVVILYHLGKQHSEERAGVEQQAISHLGIATSLMQSGTLQRYLRALGYCNEAGN